MLRIDSGAQRQCNQVIRYDAIGCAGAMQTSDHLDEIPHPSPRKGKIRKRVRCDAHRNLYFSRLTTSVDLHIQ